MLFKLTRTSLLFNERKKPLDDEQVFEKKKTYTETDGKRKFNLSESDGWFSDLKPLEELIELMNQVEDELIITSEDDMLTIEIYDYYRE